LTFPITDNFAGAAGVLPSPPWTVFFQNDVLDRDGSGNVTFSFTFSASHEAVFYDPGTVAFPNDQLSQITVNWTPSASATFAYQFLIVRASGEVGLGTGTCYKFMGDSQGDNRITKYVNDTETILKTDATLTFTLGDTLRLQVVGTTITLWKNGVLWSGLTVNDSSIASGQPGHGGQYNIGASSVTPLWNTWVGDIGLPLAFGNAATAALGAMAPSITPIRGGKKKLRKRLGSTFDYSARGWFDVIMERVGIFDRDMINVNAGSNPALTGVVGTGSPGTLTPNITVAITGNAATGSVGTVAPALSVGVTGDVGTGSTGALSPEIAVALTGNAATGLVGTLSPEIALALAGVEGDTATGTLGVAFSVPLTGVEGDGSVGDVTAPNGVALSGVEGDGQTGVLTPNITVALTGVEGDSATGSLTSAIEAALSGVGGDSATGTVTPNITVGLTGVAAEGDTGHVTAPGDVTVALTGVSAEGDTGALTPSGPQPFNPTDAKYQGARKNVKFRPLKAPYEEPEDPRPEPTPHEEALVAATRPLPEAPGLFETLDAMHPAPVAAAPAVESAPKKAPPPPEEAPPAEEPPEPAPEPPKPLDPVVVLQATVRRLERALASEQVDKLRGEQALESAALRFAALSDAMSQMSAQHEIALARLRKDLAASEAAKVKIQREANTFRAMYVGEQMLNEG
jgi:hypothetical protein